MEGAHTDAADSQLSQLHGSTVVVVAAAAASSSAMGLSFLLAESSYSTRSRAGGASPPPSLLPRNGSTHSRCRLRGLHVRVMGLLAVLLRGRARGSAVGLAVLGRARGGAMGRRRASGRPQRRLAPRKYSAAPMVPRLA